MVSDTTLSLEVREWSKKIVERPEVADYYAQRAGVLAKEDRMGLAILDFEKAIAIDGDKPKFYYDLGDIYFADNQTSKALEQYRQAETINPNDQEAVFKHAQFLYFVRQFEKSNIKFGKLLNLNPEHAEGHFFLGMLNKEDGDTLGAIQHFNQVNTLLGSDYNSCMQLAQIYVAQDEGDKALQFFEKAINLDPTSDEAYYARGLFYQNKQMDLLAMKDYQKTIDLNSAHYYAYYNAGNILAKDGNYISAIDHFEICLRLKTDFVKAYNRIGQCFELLNKPDKAAENYKKCLQIDPNFALAKEGLSRLG